MSSSNSNLFPLSQFGLHNLAAKTSEAVTKTFLWAGIFNLSGPTKKSTSTKDN
jgi:hypothetical protein